MSLTIALLALMAFLLAWAGSAAMRRYALARAMLDIPNARSSHTIPTPRGGGVAFVFSFMLSALLLEQNGLMQPDLCVVYVLGGGIIALLGFRDDRKPVRNLVKLGVHLAVSAAATWVLWHAYSLPWAWWGAGTIGAFVFYTVALTWGINLYNFMDGIDGLAVSQAIFLSLSGALLIMLGGGVAQEALLLAAACLGFAFLNWPPARLFMGDAGSGFLGFVLSVIAVESVCRHETSIWIWLILGGVFVVDATYTLLRRAFSGQRWFEAHRSHAYQHAAVRWGSHRRVTVAAQWINYFWLLPWALASQFLPSMGAIFCVLALLPLLAAAVFLRAGQAAQLAGRVDTPVAQTAEMQGRLLGSGH